MFNTVVTNVPGPTEPLYFAGARLASILGLANLANGLGLIHGIVSYCGQFMVNVTGCREMMPDPGVYARCIQASFEETLQATQ